MRFLFKKKKKQLEKDKYRVIKISKDALWEFIYESVIDKQESFFDVSDGTEITTFHDIDFKSGSYICLVKSSADDESPMALQLPEEIDLQALLKSMEDTTSSLYQPNRYKEFSIDEIKDLQAHKPNAETLAAMREAERIAVDPNAKRYKNFAELEEAIESEA